MLAADHRWQWEEWCDQQRVARSRIPDTKRVALDGLLAARRRSTDAAGVIPHYWKIEGSTSTRAMQKVDAAVAERPGPKLVILGKAAGFDVIEAWFRTAATMKTAAGFAIGRSVYWQPAADYLLNKIDETAAAQEIANNYLRVIDAWKAARDA